MAGKQAYNSVLNLSTYNPKKILGDIYYYDLYLCLNLCHII